MNERFILPVKKILPILCIVIILLGIAGTVYFSLQNTRLKEELTQKNIVIQAEADRKIPKLPPNLVKISECVPLEGEHWINPKDLPNGPLFSIYNGKIISIEYMFLPDEIPGVAASKLSFEETMKFMQQNKLTFADYVHLLDYGFDLSDYDFKFFTLHWIAPHVGLVKPHYDIHFYLVNRNEVDQICPESKIENVYSPSVMKTIHDNNIPFPGEATQVPTKAKPTGMVMPSN